MPASFPASAPHGLLTQFPSVGSHPSASGPCLFLLLPYPVPPHLPTGTSNPIASPTSPNGPYPVVSSHAEVPRHLPPAPSTSTNSTSHAADTEDLDSGPSLLDALQ